MKKFLESIGLIEGYDIIEIEKMKAKKTVCLKKLKNMIIQ